MKDSRRGDQIRLKHGLDAIKEIESYLFDVDFLTFSNNSMIRFACIKQLEIIGEACNHVSEETKTKFTYVPWMQIIGLRNLLIHEYFGVDLHIVWEIVTEEIPLLESQLEKILQFLTNE